MSLSLNDVRKSFGKCEVLKGLNAEFSSGLVGLLGPNGAGKSTLLKLLATLITPSSGTISWKGLDISVDPRKLRAVLGYLPQDFGLYPHLSAREFLQYIAAAKNMPNSVSKREIDSLLSLVNLDGLGRLRLQHFSGGMQRRLGIAQALLNNPSLILLDEPTAGLDPDERLQFHNLLSEISTERLIILSTHIVSDIESIANRVVVLSSGTFKYEGAQNAMLAEVEGKVWSVTLPRHEARGLAREYLTSAVIYSRTTATVRVIAAERPCDGLSILPSLEDAYLWLTRSSST